MNYQLNPLFEVSLNVLSKKIKNGLIDRGSTIAALKNGAPELRRSIRPSEILTQKISSKTESQIQRLWKRLVKQNNGDIEKSKREWNSIWDNIHKNMTHEYNPLESTSEAIRKSTDARLLRNIMDRISSIEARTIKKPVNL